MATMNISLPDELKQFIDAQVSEHGYGSSSEYLRELIRKQRDVERLRNLLVDGANSGPGRLVDDAFFTELKAVAKNRDEHEAQVDVWRMQQEHHDSPAWMREPSPSTSGKLPDHEKQD